MKLDYNKYKRLQTALPLIILIVLFIVFGVLFIGIKHKNWLFEPIKSSNLMLYIFSFLTGAVAFFILRLILSGLDLKWFRKITERKFSSKISLRMTIILCGIIGILLIHRRFFSEFSEYPARDIPYKSIHLLPAPIALLLIITVSILLLRWYKIPSKGKIIKIFTFVSYIFSVFFVYFSLYTPTLDKDSSFDVFHGTAYIQSIYNSLYYVPFTRETTGVYGHYGIIFAALMRLFHLKSEHVFTLISIAGLVTTVCSIYAIHKIIKNDYLRIIAALSLPIPQALVYTRNYWMTYPHKTLFPMMLIAWLVFVFNHKDTEHKHAKQKLINFLFTAGAYLISLIGIVWNTETGLYCLVCTAGAYFVRDWQKKGWLSPFMLIRYIYHAILSIASIAGAYGIVYLYNTYCGHRLGSRTDLSLSDFFFPLGEINSFIGSGSHADVTFGNHAWIYVLLLFLLSGFYTLRHTTFFSGQEDRIYNQIPVIASISLLGIMHFALYFEHAAYGKLSMCLLPAVIIIAYLCDCYDPNLPAWGACSNIIEICKRTFTVVGILILTVLSAEVLTMGPITLGLHGYWDHGKSDIHHLASLYNTIVPTDTFSIGSCVYVINYQLHQESNAHYRDLSNLNLGGISVSDKIVNDALTHDYFSIWIMGNGEDFLLEKILYADPSYELAREINLGGYPLRVYSRIEELP